MVAGLELRADEGKGLAFESRCVGALLHGNCLQSVVILVHSNYETSSLESKSQCAGSILAELGRKVGLGLHRFERTGGLQMTQEQTAAPSQIRAFQQLLLGVQRKGECKAENVARNPKRQTFEEFTEASNCRVLAGQE